MVLSWERQMGSQFDGRHCNSMSERTCERVDQTERFYVSYQSQMPLDC